MARTRLSHSWRFSALFLSSFCALILYTQDARAELVEVTQKQSNKVLSVEVVRLEGEKLTFKLKNDREFTIDLGMLTEGSVAKIRASVAATDRLNTEKFAVVNKVIGHDLFDRGSLWNESAVEVAKRLRWPKESITDQSSSFRHYTGKDYQFLGAHPYCATLYGGKGGVVSHLSLVFANKGDFGSSAGFGEDHFKRLHPDVELPSTLEEAISTDAKLINASLSSYMGEAVTQYYGEKEDRRNVQRWDFGNHAFLLSEVDMEYTSLLIVSKKNADLAGKVDFVKDSDLKQIVLKNVVTEKNGDVLIKNIPMVDQGPKGYCAPATFERAMRYMLVPADMYLLATAATTQEGTNTRLLAESSKRIVRSKARRIKELDLERDLKIRNVKRYIDKGVPILWQMRSLKEYNKIANQRTKERASVTDFSDWTVAIAQQAEEVAPRMLERLENYHICMIIGYNEETNELAVSDSWGARYELRWVHVDIAKAVTSAGGFVIDL